MPNVILAFAGRVLLKQTKLQLEKGHRYALVGQNGVGKTTLLNRINAGDINGFPSSLPRYFIEHEIIAETGEKCIPFLVRTGPPGVDERTVVDKLTRVGFDEKQMGKTVSELSGGWRMKLAIGRSMLFTKQLLLLDEPTNHLDAASKAWLVEYINVQLQAQDMCVVIVSHDYDFLTEVPDPPPRPPVTGLNAHTRRPARRCEGRGACAQRWSGLQVCTDVVHISNKHLGYFSGGFKRFQEERPEIVAGLPKARDRRTYTPRTALQSLHRRAALQAGDTIREAGGSKFVIETKVEAPAEKVIYKTQAEEDYAKSQATLAKMLAGESHVQILPMLFPDPGKLDGISALGKVVMKMTNVTFKYPTAPAYILTDATVKMTRLSRVALVGPNGAGKTTLLKLLVGEL